MPGRDGTGPMGYGTVTGRGFGGCCGYGRGLGFRSGLGQGLGMRRGFGRFVYPAAPEMTEKEWLLDQQKMLLEQLEAISKKMDENKE